MLIQHTEDGHKGSFFVENEGNLLAEMTYSMAGDNVMIIDHTEVDDSLRGKNVGAQLVHNGAEYARSRSYKIFPLCPFAKAFFEKKHAEYEDVLRK